MGPSPQPESKELARSINEFAFDLLHQVPRGENLVFSPASIHLGLCMTWAGARGRTADEMAGVLHLEAPTEAVHRAASILLRAWNNEAADPNQLSMANRLFGEKAYEFEEPFLQVTRQYGAELERLRFAGEAELSRSAINEWVARTTKDRIRELLPARSIDEGTRLVLVDAVHFLGKWLKPFDRNQTRDAPFHRNESRSVSVPTMHVVDRFRYSESQGLQVLEMPFLGDRFSMVFLLPSKEHDLSALERKATDANIKALLAGLERVRVDVSVPRFRLELRQALALKPSLSAMGMPLAFDEARADFRGMANPPQPSDQLFMAETYHKAFVEVNEQGAEAAAATAGSTRFCCTSSDSSPIFKADRPFLFFIRDRMSEVILVMGRVQEPG